MSKKRTQGEGWSFTSANEESTKSTPTNVSLAPEQQKARISLEKRKKGKIVTLISGLVLSAKDLKALGKSLKVACGTGGTARNNEIELQGDCRDKARNWLQANNWGLKK